MPHAAGRAAGAKGGRCRGGAAGGLSCPARAAPARTGAAGHRARRRRGRAGLPSVPTRRSPAANRRGPRRDLRHREVGAMMWAGVLVACAACYALKLAGLSLPASVLQDARWQRTVPLVPVALLAALVATQTFSTAHHLAVDVRTPP